MNDDGALGQFHEYPEEEKETIRRGSKALTAREALMPIYYREAHAFFYGLRECRYYIDASPFETLVLTDHMPLKWIAHSQSDRITPWTLEEFAGMTIKLVYKRGDQNRGADALSREPIVNARPMLQVGLQSHTEALFSRFNDCNEVRSASTMWFYAGSDTQTGSRWLQDWRHGSNPILNKSPTGNNFDQNYDFAIISPSGGRAPSVCEKLFRSGKKFACLVPSDLVSWIPYSNLQGKDETIYQMLQESYKMIFMDSGLTWIVHGLDGECKNECVCYNIN